MYVCMYVYITHQFSLVYCTTNFSHTLIWRYSCTVFIVLINVCCWCCSTLTMFASSYLHSSTWLGQHFTLNTGNVIVLSTLIVGVLATSRMNCLLNHGHYSMSVDSGAAVTLVIQFIYFIIWPCFFSCFSSILVAFEMAISYCVRLGTVEKNLFVLCLIVIRGDNFLFFFQVLRVLISYVVFWCRIAVLLILPVSVNWLLPKAPATMSGGALRLCCQLHLLKTE